MARDVRAYILERADAGRSMGTLRADAAGIAAVHRAAGQRGPCEPRGVVSATLARLAKSEPHAHAPRQVDGLTAEALAAIQADGLPATAATRAAVNPPPPPNGAGAWISRLCERCSPMPGCDGRKRPRSRGRISVTGRRRQSGRVTVRRSKTDQAGQGAILYVTAATMAALAAIRQGALNAAPVFGLSAGQIGRRITAAAAAAGLGAGYSGHSGRAGLAVRMTASGRADPRGHAGRPLAGGRRWWHALHAVASSAADAAALPLTAPDGIRRAASRGRTSHAPLHAPHSPAQRSAGCGGIKPCCRPHGVPRRLRPPVQPCLAALWSL